MITQAKRWLAIGEKLFGANTPTHAITPLVHYAQDLQQAPWFDEQLEQWLDNLAATPLLPELYPNRIQAAALPTEQDLYWILHEATYKELWGWVLGAKLGMHQVACQLLYETILQRQPNDAYANYALGRELIATDTTAALSYLERAAAHQETLMPASYLAVRQLSLMRKDAQINQWRERAIRQRQINIAARHERKYLQMNDIFHPHDWPFALAAQFGEALEGFAEVRHAWLGRKTLRQFTGYPLYVLVLELAPAARQDFLADLIKRFDWPYSVALISCHGASRTLAKEVQEHSSQLF